MNFGIQLSLLKIPTLFVSVFNVSNWMTPAHLTNDDHGYFLPMFSLYLMHIERVDDFNMFQMLSFLCFLFL